jgi:ADP-ribose pyrophosphatase YjhB (NUDIX family)
MSDQNKELLHQAMQIIDDLVPNSRNGLPEPLFLLTSRLTPLVNVDLLVIHNDGKKLLTWRHDNFYGPGWHIPGGIVRFRETMADRLQKVALLEFGCEVEQVGETLKVTEIFHPDRDIRGHFISHLIPVRLRGELDESHRANLSAPRPGDWAWFESAPVDLISQHRRFIDFLNTPFR